MQHISQVNRIPQRTVSRIKLSKPQSRVFSSRSALTLDMAGQRAGKSQMIGVLTGYYITQFPKLKGFIAANTYSQLSTSTLEKAFEIWRTKFNLTKYDLKGNPGGDYVIGRMPPPHFTKWREYPFYEGIISFKNGHVIYIGSLDNYAAHDGKEFAYAHLDETKDTKEVALTSVILARLSQRGLFVQPGGGLAYLDYVEDSTDGGPGMYVDAAGDLVDTAGLGYRAFAPCWIHTSPAVGNVDWLIKMFGLADDEKAIREAVTNKETFYQKETPEINSIIYSTYWNEGNLPANYIDGRLRILSENEALKFVFGFPFSKMGGEWYPSFTRAKHVTPLNFLPSKAVHVCWDFNVVPYLTMVCCQMQYVTRYRDINTGKKHYSPGVGLIPVEFTQIRVFREFCFTDPLNDSDVVIDHFKAAYGAQHAAHPFDVFVYGDAQGRNRIEGMGSTTRFSRIEAQFGSWLAADSMRVNRQNMNPLVRRELMARILEDKLNIEILFDDKAAPYMVSDMEYVKLGPEGKLKEKVADPNNPQIKYEKNGHTSDALEYLVSYIFGEIMEAA